MPGWIDKMLGELSLKARLAIGSVALAGAVGGTAYAVAYVESAEPCQRRSIGPLTIDRTSECPTKVGGQTNITVAAPDTVKISAISVADPYRTAIEVLPPGHKQEEMRRVHGLLLVEAEVETLESMPAGTYAYVWGGTFATHWHKEHNRLTVRRSMRAEYFEIDKRKDGRAFLIGFVRGDAAKAFTHGTSGPNNIKVYARRYGKNDVVIAIPVAALASVGQDEITFPNDAIIPVLDLGLKGPYSNHQSGP